MISALSRQSDLNRYSAHLLHNLVLELTRLNLEVQELRNRNLQLAGRVEMLARRAKTLEEMAAADRRTRRAGRRNDRNGSGAPRRVHQLLAALSYGDAISNEALAIQGHLRAAGFASDIFAEKVHPRMAHLARPLWEYRERESSPGQRLPLPLLDRKRGRPDGVPRARTAWWPSTTTSPRPEFFLGFHPHLAGLCHHGRRELEAFAPRTALALGDSEYNRRELEAAGFERTGVLPIVLDLAKYDRPASLRRPPPLRRRAHQHPLRGTHHPQQEDRGPGADLRRLPALGGAPQSAPPRGRHPGLRALLRSSAGAGERAAGGRGGLHRAGGRRRAVRLLPGGRRLPLPLRARGVLRSRCRRPCTSGCRWRPTMRGRSGRPSTGGAFSSATSDPMEVAELLGRLRQDTPLRRAVLATQERAVAEIRSTDFGALLLERLRPVLEGEVGTGGRRPP